MAAAFGYTDIELRAAANLGIGAAFSSAQFGCYGMAAITVSLTATGTDLLASGTFDLSDDPLTTAAASSVWQPVAGSSGLYEVTQNYTGFNMSIGGIRASLHPFLATSMSGAKCGLTWKKCRFSGVGHAVNVINGFRIVATAWDWT